MKLPSLLGILLIAIGAVAYLAIPERGEWPALVLMLVGAHLISRRELGAALRAVSRYIPGFKGGADA